MTEDEARLLLQDGRTFDLPDGYTTRDLHALEQVGLIRTAQTEVFRCRDRPGGFPVGPIDQGCDAVLEFRGLTEPHPCDQCGAEHWLEDEQAGLGHRVRVRLVREGVERKLDELLRRLDDRCRRMPDAVVWRVFVEGRDVYVCVLDWSRDTRFVSRAFASTNAIVYVVVDWRHFAGRFGEELGVVLPLYKVIANEAELEHALVGAPDAPHPLVASEPQPPVWNPVPPPSPLVYRQFLGARELVVTDKAATLDGVEVLGTRASGLVPILRFLVERWREDLVDGKSPDDHCCFTVAEIREYLRDDRGRAPTEGTVRKRLTRIRQAIPERYKAQARRTLGPDAVVEHVDGFGYRLRPLGLSAHLS